jgi:hypothetical protein
VNRLRLVGTVAGFKSDANINFFDTTLGFFSPSVLPGFGKRKYTIPREPAPRG